MAKTSKDEKSGKDWFSGLLDKIDRRLEEKAEARGCCCCDGDDKQCKPSKKAKNK